MMRYLARAVVTSVLLLECSSKDSQFSDHDVAVALKSGSQIDATQLRAHVEKVVELRLDEAPLVSPYSMQGPITHVNSTTFVRDAFRTLGYTPTEEAFGGPTTPGTNVYVDVAGDLPDLVIVSGHHDAWFQSGADDNGTALAVLIETARALFGAHFRRTIRLVAFDREEEGLIGSTSYFQTHAAETVRILLNMDCVGYASHASGSQDAPPGFALRDVGDFIAVLANEPAHEDASRFVRLAGQMEQPIDALGLLAPGDSFNPGAGAFLRSDHAQAWASGIPALFITDTANFRNHNDHPREDTPDKLDYAFLTSVTQLVVGAAAAFAETE